MYVKVKQVFKLTKLIIVFNVIGGIRFSLLH